MIQVLGLVQFGVVKWLWVFDDKVKVWSGFFVTPLNETIQFLEPKNVKYCSQRLLDDLNLYVNISFVSGK